MGPVLREDHPAESIDLHLPHDAPESSGFQTQIEEPAAGKERTDGQHHAPGT
jgi:hypothetical protein